MAVVEVVVTVPAEQEELAVACLAEYAPGGFRHESPGDAGGLADHARFGVYVEASQADAVVGFLARAGIDVGDSHVAIVADDYNERWKEFHQPVQIGGLWVGPPWQEHLAPADAKKVVIEPAQGFGTGAHATTRLVLGLLLDQPRASVLDIGCGSGVLAIAAALLGFKPIVAVDNDQDAVDSARDNLRRNGVEQLVQLGTLDALTDPIPAADIVLANLTLEPLVGLAPRLKAPRVVVSGLLRSQVDTAAAAFEEHQYVVRERLDRDGWAALVLDNVRDDRSTMFHRQVF